MFPTSDKINFSDKMDTVLLPLYNLQQKKVQIRKKVIQLWLGIIPSLILWLGTTFVWLIAGNTILTVGLCILSLLLLIFFLYKRNQQHRIFLSFFQEEVFPIFIPIFFPNFVYHNTPLLDLEKIRSWKHWKKYYKVKPIGIEHHITGQIGPSVVTLLYKIRVKASYFERGEDKTIQRVEKPIFIYITGLPPSFDLKKLDRNAYFSNIRKETARFWNAPVVIQLLSTTSLLLTIRPEKSAFQPKLWDKAVTYQSNFMAQYYEQLYHCFHPVAALVEAIETP